MSELSYEIRLRVRRPGSPACPDHRVAAEAEAVMRIPAGTDHDAVRRAAEQVFRKLGLGAVMDLPGAEWFIDVWPLRPAR